MRKNKRLQKTKHQKIKLCIVGGAFFLLMASVPTFFKRSLDNRGVCGETQLFDGQNDQNVDPIKMFRAYASSRTDRVDFASQENERIDQAVDFIQADKSAEEDLKSFDRYKANKFFLNETLLAEKEKKETAAKRIEDESVQAEENGKIAVEMRDLDAAKQYYEMAIEKCRQLYMRNGGNTSRAFKRLRDLQTELVSLNSMRCYHEIKTLFYEGEQALVAKDLPQAISCYEEALKQQKRLNENYPNSKYAANKHDFNELNEKINRIHNEIIYASIERDKPVLERNLRTRNLKEAKAMINAIAQKATRLRISEKVDASQKEFLEKVSYLASKKDQLEKIQNIVYDSLVQIPGISGEIYMTRVPVTQELYESVMGVNPSRSTGNGQFPVESVTYAEAKLFCKYLGWIMGQDATMPTKVMYEHALSAEIPEHRNAPVYAWLWEETEGKIQPVGLKAPNEYGFLDLLGNVSEWVLFEDNNNEDDKTFVFGGSAEDTFCQLQNNIWRLSCVRDRDRTVGFRYTVTLEK